MSFTIYQGTPVAGSEHPRFLFQNEYLDCEMDCEFALVVSSEHPDGAEGYRHPHWKDDCPLLTKFSNDREALEQIGRAYTPELRRRALTQEPLYWSGMNDAYHAGWMTPEGERKYTAPPTRDLGALTLTDADFVDGVTMDMLYHLILYQTLGWSYEIGWLHPSGVEQIRASMDALEGASDPIRASYLEYKNSATRRA